MRKRDFSRRRSSSRRPRSRKPFLIVGGALVGALVWFAPTIAVRSPLKNRIISSATSDLRGKVSVGSVSAGWLSPIVARDIVVFDVDGERIVELASARIDKTLVSLIGDRTDLGTVAIERPVINLVLRRDGSNLEDAIAEYLKPSEEPASPIGCEFTVTHGTVNVTDATTGSQWQAADLEATAVLPKDANSPITARVDTALALPDGEAGHLKSELLWQRDEPDAANVGKGNLSIAAQSLPIDLAAPVLSRFAPGVAAGGVLDGGVQLDWGETNQTVEVAALSVNDFTLSAPQWIGQERIDLKSIATSGKLAHRAGSWEVDQLQLESDLGTLKATGSAVIQPSETGNLVNEILEALRYGRIQLEGQFDLARLARMIPQTLHVRAGTRVSTGQLTVGLVSDSSTGKQRWDSRFAVSDLSAMYQGRRLESRQPIVLTVAVEESAGEISIEQLTCTSSFLTVNANGSSAAGSATLSGDFALLAAEVGKFIDLGGAKLAGQLNANVDWRQETEQKWQVEGTAAAKQFELIAAEQRPWREQHLSVSFSGVGQPSERNLRALDEAEFRVASGGDELSLEVLPAPAGSVRDASWPIKVDVKGELATWLARLQPFVALRGWNIDGALDLTATADVAVDRVQIKRADAFITNLYASNGTVFVNENRVEIGTKGLWDQQTGTFTSPDTTFASSTVAFRAADVAVRTSGPSFAGSLSYRGDLGRLLALTSDPKQPASRQLAGQATGTLAARYDKGVTTGTLSADVKEFAYLTRTEPKAQPILNASREEAWSEVWREPEMKLGASVTYDPAADSLQIAELQAAASTVSIGASGSVKELSQRCTADISGQVAYDLQQVTARFRQTLGDDFQISGRDTRPFRFQGPLLPASKEPDALHPVSLENQPATTDSLSEMLADMMAQASLGWSSAQVQGFAIGPGELDARLQSGVLRVNPFELPVAEGRMHLAPQIYLDRTPMVMTLPKGPLVEQVQISPEMCGKWLKYVAPLVANATAAQGRFSVSLAGATIPLDAPTGGDVEGELEIHQAQVGPGPLSQQLLWLASAIKAAADGRPWDGTSTLANTWLDLPQQRVAFRMVDERVYHDGLQVQVKDVVIRTKGSVGTDQTISLEAEVPVRDEWVARSRYLASLRGQSLRVPIHGTLTSPKLDQSAIRQITQQAAMGAVNGLIQDEVNKGLNSLLEKAFGPAPQ